MNSPDLVVHEDEVFSGFDCIKERHGERPASSHLLSKEEALLDIFVH